MDGTMARMENRQLREVTQNDRPNGGCGGRHRAISGAALDVPSILSRYTACPRCADSLSFTRCGLEVFLVSGVSSKRQQRNCQPGFREAIKKIIAFPDNKKKYSGQIGCTGNGSYRKKHSPRVLLVRVRTRAGLKSGHMYCLASRPKGQWQQGWRSNIAIQFV